MVTKACVLFIRSCLDDASGGETNLHPHLAPQTRRDTDTFEFTCFRKQTALHRWGAGSDHKDKGLERRNVIDVVVFVCRWVPALDVNSFLLIFLFLLCDHYDDLMSSSLRWMLFLR